MPSVAEDAVPYMLGEWISTSLPLGAEGTVPYMLGE